MLKIIFGSVEYGVAFETLFCNRANNLSRNIKQKKHKFWINYEKLNKKMPKSIRLDLGKIPWHISMEIAHSLQVIVSRNINNVTQWSNTIALSREYGRLINKEKILILYEPFKIDKKHFIQSNYFL